MTYFTLVRCEVKSGGVVWLGPVGMFESKHFFGMKRAPIQENVTIFLVSKRCFKRHRLANSLMMMRGLILFISRNVRGGQCESEHSSNEIHLLTIKSREKNSDAFTENRERKTAQFERDCGVIEKCRVSCNE